MPSGAKKRKAAKKKKDTGTPNSNNPGNDEEKSQDSDGDEFSTPADSHQTPFETGEFRTPAVGFHQTPFETGEFKTPAVGFHQTPFQAGGEGSHRRLVSESESFVEAVPDLESPGHALSSKGSRDKDDTNSRSSSSDDEKQGKGEAPSFGDMMSKEVGKLKDIATSGGNALVTDVVKPVVSVSSMGLARVKEYAPASSEPIGSVLKENGEKLMAKFDELTRTSPTAVDSQSNKKGDASNTVKFAPEDSEGKAVSSSNPPSNETGNGAEHPKTPQNPESEPLLPVAPRRVRTSSWKTCCGLCDVLFGSNR